MEKKIPTYEEVVKFGPYRTALKEGSELDWGVRTPEEQIAILRRKIQIFVAALIERQSKAA
jgi:hypothetical protein